MTTKVYALITSGSTVEFAVRFYDANGGETSPSSATLTMTYPLSSNSLTTASCTIGMSPAAPGSIFLANWGSGVAAFGLTTFSITAPGQATPTTGALKITN